MAGKFEWISLNKALLKFIIEREVKYRKHFTNSLKYIYKTSSLEFAVIRFHVSDPAIAPRGGAIK